VYKCEYCELLFTQKTSLSSHLDRCSTKIETQLQEKHKKEMHLLRKENRRFKKEAIELQEKLQEKHEKEMHLLRKESRRAKTEAIENTKELKMIHKKEISNLHSNLDVKCEKISKLKQIMKKKDEEISNLKVKCESGKIEVYDKVCTKVLDKPTVTNNSTSNGATTNIYTKLAKLPISNIPPLTLDYIKECVDNGDYTFEHYLKGPDGIVDFIRSIVMRENDDGEMEKNCICGDPSRDSYHRLIETREWQKDQGGKFMDDILNAVKGPTDIYHKQMLQERIGNKGYDRTKGYDPDEIFKSNDEMHSGVVRTYGPERRALRSRMKKEINKNITI
jgi:hypothetical protein